MILTYPMEGKNMHSEEDIKKVLQAAYDADPEFEDSDMDLIRDTLRWVLGDDSSTAQQFIELHIADA